MNVLSQISNIPDLLSSARSKRERVDIHLRSGKTFQGLVAGLWDGAVTLRSPDFMDVLILISEIEAVVVVAA